MNFLNPWLILLLIIIAVGLWGALRKTKDDTDAGVELGPEPAEPGGPREQPQDTGGGPGPKGNP